MSHIYTNKYVRLKINLPVLTKRALTKPDRLKTCIVCQQAMIRVVNF